MQRCCNCPLTQALLLPVTVTAILSMDLMLLAVKVDMTALPLMQIRIMMSKLLLFRPVMMLSCGRIVMLGQAHLSLLNLLKQRSVRIQAS
jgi:hypothetical protein